MKDIFYIETITNFIKRHKFLISQSPHNLFLTVLIFILIAILDVVGIAVISPLITSMTNPEKIGEIIEEFLKISIDPDNVFIYVSILTICVFVLKSAAAFFAQRYILKFSFKTRASLINKLASKYIFLPITFHNQHNVASAIQKIQGNTHIYLDRSLIPLMRAISELFVLMAIVIFLSYISPVIFFSALFFMSLIIFFYNKFLRKLYFFSGKKEIEASEKVIQYVKEALTAIREVRISNTESFFNNRIKKSSEEQSDAATTSQSYTILPRYILEVALTTFIVMIGLSYYLSDVENMTEVFPILGVFAVASFRLIPSLNHISVAISQSTISFSALDQIYSDLLEEEITESSAFKNHYVEQKELIKLENISYCVDKRKIFENVNLSIYKGDFIGIIGSSGSGKTTLINIISGLLKPSHGFVTLNKKLNESGSQFALVDQNPVILNDSIKQNIALGIEDTLIDEKKVIEAISLSDLDQYFDSINRNLDSFLSADGLNISGGQKQKIALARAIYFDKEILLLDEPTSALDQNSERKILDLINSFQKTKTIIMITHNLNLLGKCNRIVEIQGNKFTEVKNVT